MRRKVVKKNSIIRGNKIEQKVATILSSMKVFFEQEVQIEKYNVDFLINGEYIVECYGDFWHCNPQKYKSNYFNRGKKKTAKEIWERDLGRKKLFEELGYKFIHLWECDIRNNPKKIKSKLKKFLN